MIFYLVLAIEILGNPNEKLVYVGYTNKGYIRVHIG